MNLGNLTAAVDLVCRVWFLEIAFRAESSRRFGLLAQ